MSGDPVFDQFAATPINRLLGMRLVHRSAERVEVELPVRTDLLQETGVVQGGVLTAVADTAAVYLLWPDLAPARTMTGIGCNVQFLSGATIDGGAVRAIAAPLRIGATIAVCESVLLQGERVVAKGTFTFLLRERRR